MISIYLEADRDGNVPVVVQIVQKTSDRQDDKVGIRVDFYKVSSFNQNIFSPEPDFAIILLS